MLAGLLIGLVGSIVIFAIAFILSGTSSKNKKDVSGL